MRTEWIIYDKRTEEKLVGYHESVGIFEFERTDNPRRLYLTVDELIIALGRIERTTGRKIGCEEVSQ
jgi:hypothetical protein